MTVQERRSTALPGRPLAGDGPAVACVICKADAVGLWDGLPDRLHPEVRGLYALWRCANCGLILVHPQPSPEKLADHYPPTYHVYQRSLRVPGGWRARVIRAVADDFFGYGRARPWRRPVLAAFYFKLLHLPCFVPGARVLDVGCGDGSRLALFRVLGWDGVGIEVNAALVEHLRSLGLDVRQGEVDDLELPAEHFDAVYLNNVFEHIRSPHTALAALGRALKPGGELVLVVPNGRSLAFRLFRRHWFSLEVPRHLFLYNLHNLAFLLDQHGFSVVRARYMHTLGSLTSSLVYALGRPVDAFAVAERPPWLLNFLLDPIFEVFGIGEWVVVRARKSQAGAQA